MIKAVVLIPSRDNSGRSFPESLWQDLRERFVERFGGVSRGRRIESAWRQSGRTYRDVSWEYVVALESWRQLSAWLEVVEWARTAFAQEALYIEVNGAPEVIGPLGA